jgi:hypothetical protein
MPGIFISSGADNFILPDERERSEYIAIRISASLLNCLALQDFARPQFFSKALVLNQEVHLSCGANLRSDLLARAALSGDSER